MFQLEVHTVHNHVGEKSKKIAEGLNLKIWDFLFFYQTIKTAEYVKSFFPGDRKSIPLMYKLYLYLPYAVIFLRGNWLLSLLHIDIHCAHACMYDDPVE